MTIRPVNYRYQDREGTFIEDIGPVYAEIELLNFTDIVLNHHGYQSDKDIRRIKLRALVNSSATDLVINNEIKDLLDVRVLEKRTVRLPDDTLREVEIVGPIEIRFENHSAYAGAMVLPDAEEVLLGRLPFAGLHVFIDKQSKQLLVIPYRPIKRVA